MSNSQESNTEVEVELNEKYFSDKIISYFTLLIFLAVLMIFMLVLLTKIIVRTPVSQFFLIDRQDRIFESFPLDKPLYTNEQVMDWSAQAAIRLLDLNFLNYRYQIFKNKELFIGQSFDRMTTILSKVILPIVVKNKYITRLNLCDVPTIDRKRTGKFKIKGVPKYIWTIHLPVYIDFKSEDSNTTVVAKMVMQVERVSDLEYLGGLAIGEFTLENPTVFQSRNYSDLPVCNNG